MNLPVHREEKSRRRRDGVGLLDQSREGRAPFPDEAEVEVQEPTHLEAFVVNVGSGRCAAAIKGSRLVPIRPASPRHENVRRRFCSAVNLTASADVVDGGDGMTLLN